jgi:hypothetical protein
LVVNRPAAAVRNKIAAVASVRALPAMIVE